MQSGILAAQTPFSTGRPVTLFQNKSIFSDGAVGLAYLAPPPSIAALELSYPTLTALGNPLPISRFGLQTG